MGPAVTQKTVNENSEAERKRDSLLPEKHTQTPHM